MALQKLRNVWTVPVNTIHANTTRPMTRWSLIKPPRCATACSTTLSSKNVVRSDTSFSSDASMQMRQQAIVGKCRANGNKCKLTQVMDPRPYYETCRWDYCQCQKDDRRECACSALERFFHECIRLGVDLADGWRDATLCRKLQHSS